MSTGDFGQFVLLVQYRREQFTRLSDVPLQIEGAIAQAQLAVTGVHLWFAKTLADFEINDIAALPPLFCYNSYVCFDSSACALEHWFASCARVGTSYSRIWLYVNNSPS